jgi:DNA repair protein RAD7
MDDFGFYWLTELPKMHLYSMEPATLISLSLTLQVCPCPSNPYIVQDPDESLDLKSPALCTLALLNPNLTSLRIDFCGCIDDTAITTWCTALPSLKRLELLGPFLIRVPAWISFFKSHPQLEGFLITQSPRFDVECAKALVANCKGLKEIRLEAIGKMDDGFVTSLKELKGHLSSLDLSYPGASLSEDALIGLMQVVGPTLTHLNLSGHDLITDAFLLEGIKPHTRTLKSLVLSDIPELTDEGVADFFSTWGEVAMSDNVNPPLASLDISRNQQLSSEALTAVLAHSGSALHYLNINGWKSTSEDALNEIAKYAVSLRSLDAGWCREVNDFVVKELMAQCEFLKEVKVWGCNRLSDHCPRKVS